MKKNRIVLVFFAVAAIVLANMHLSVNETEKSDLSITAFRNAEAVGCSECYYPMKCSSNECIYPKATFAYYDYSASCFCDPPGIWYSCVTMDLLCEFDYDRGNQYCNEVYGVVVSGGCP